MLLVPILLMNRSKSIWGEDSFEFKYAFVSFFVMSANVYLLVRPERWQSSPEAAAHIPGVWGNMLTFLGGPRACIGYRFSLVEYVGVVINIGTSNDLISL